MILNQYVRAFWHKKECGVKFNDILISINIFRYKLTKKHYASLTIILFMCYKIIVNKMFC